MVGHSVDASDEHEGKVSAGDAAPLPSERTSRFGSGAPLAPPRPGQSSVPPRSLSATPPPPPVLPTSESAAPPSPETIIAGLREQLETAQRAWSAKQAELRTLLVQRDARIAEASALRRELDQAKAAAAARLSELEQRLHDQQQAHAAAVAERDQRLAELEQTHRATSEQLERLQRELGELRSRGEPADDLQQIRGIGPAFARELSKLGIRTYAQIAAWTSADIEAIAPKIKARIDRIRRDDWPGRAAALAQRRGE